MTNPSDDPRLDPRIAAILDLLPTGPMPDIESRDAVLAEANAPEARAEYEAGMQAMELLDDENTAPSTGLASTEHEFTSQPDGNRIKVLFIRPEGDAILPGVVYSTAAACNRCPASTACTGRGTHDRRSGHRRRDGRLPQRGLRVVGTRGRAVPRRAERLRQRREVGARQAASLGVDPAKLVIAGESAVATSPSPRA